MASFSAFLPLLMLFLSFLSYGGAQDFCVADLTLPITPSGYPCKQVVTADDFAFSGLRTFGDVIKPIRAAVTPAFAPQFPAVNGLGISVARFDFLPTGLMTLHTHPAASEIFLVIKGVISAGFLSSPDNVVYNKTLYAGDVMVFPRGLSHYQINVGNSNALAFAFFDHTAPWLQVTPLTLFDSDLPMETVAKTTFISQQEVARLKALFAGFVSH